MGFNPPGVIFRDKDGNQIDLEEWVKFKSDKYYFIIAKTDVGKNRVSTAWLGTPTFIHPESQIETTIEQQFETMIFPQSATWGQCNNLEAALEMHEAAVKHLTCEHEQRNKEAGD